MLGAALPAAGSALPLFGGGRTLLPFVKTPASHLLAVAPSVSLAELKYRDKKQCRGGRELFQHSSRFQPITVGKPRQELRTRICHILVKNEGNECMCVALLSFWDLEQ